MKVVYTLPPLYRDIARTFEVRGKPVLFCFGDTIHNPSRIPIPPELMAHETVHSGRQGDCPEAWWADYLSDPEFRLMEELPAHIAEFGAFCQRMSARSAQQTALHRIATRLSSPLYGMLIEYHEARRRIEDGVTNL
jgi:hypothetical protein